MGSPQRLGDREGRPGAPPRLVGPSRPVCLQTVARFPPGRLLGPCSPSCPTPTPVPRLVHLGPGRQAAAESTWQGRLSWGPAPACGQEMWPPVRDRHAGPPVSISSVEDHVPQTSAALVAQMEGVLCAVFSGIPGCLGRGVASYPWSRLWASRAGRCSGSGVARVGGGLGRQTVESSAGRQERGGGL